MFHKKENDSLFGITSKTLVYGVVGNIREIRPPFLQGALE